MASVSANIIPHEIMLYSQGMHAVFILQVIGLIFCPVCEVIGLIVRPDESSFSVSIAQPNPSLGAIQSMLSIDIIFLVSYIDEVGAAIVRLAGFLSLSPVLA